MVDWTGLLNWSTQYHDGTAPSNFKPMSEADKKWLEEAFASKMINEPKKIKEINEMLFNDKEVPNEENIKLNLFEELSDLLEGPRNSEDYHKLGGLIPLIEMSLSNKYLSLKLKATQVLSLISQNNTIVQKNCLECRALRILEKIKKENPPQLNEAYLGALSSLVRGEYIDIKKEFISLKGIELIIGLINDSSSTDKMKLKCLILSQDLFFYEEKLFGKKGVLYESFLKMNLFEKIIECIANVGKDLYYTRMASSEIIKLFFSFNSGLKQKYLNHIKDHIQQLKEYQNSMNDKNDKDFIEEEKQLFQSLID